MALRIRYIRRYSKAQLLTTSQDRFVITQTVTNLSFVAAMYCVATTSDHYRDLYYIIVIYSEWSCMTGEVYIDQIMH